MRRLDEVTRSLTGQRISDLRYYALGVDRRDDALWDRGEWHALLEGVHFSLSDGSHHEAEWDMTFGHFSLELTPSLTTAHTASDGGGFATWSPVEHHRWARLVADPVSRATIVWRDDIVDPPGAAPAALRLDFPAGTAWIVAAKELSDDEFWVGANEVMVVFDADFAALLRVAGQD